MGSDVAQRQQAALKTLFLCLAVLGGFGTICRADYNLPLFALLYWRFFNVRVDRRRRQQILMLLIILFSCVVDVLYYLYWVPTWLRSDWAAVPNARKHWSGLGITTLELAAKVILLVLALVPRSTFVCKPDEFNEYEIVTYSQVPEGPRIYQEIKA